MTIPTLHQSITEKVAVARLQKTYSTLENAFRLAVQENGTPDEWGLTDEEGSKSNALIITNKLKPYLNFIQICDNNNDTACWPNEIPTNIPAKLADGTLLAFEVNRGICTTVRGAVKSLERQCGSISVKIDGNKTPIKIGINTFAFWLTAYGITPFGIQAQTDYKFEEYCLPDIPAGPHGGKQSCTAWVIYNGNMDYLHCKDLSWDGSHSCK